jgi:hypothetical protein
MPGTAAAGYDFAAAATGLRASIGAVTTTYTFAAAAVGSSPKTGAAAAAYQWTPITGIGDNGVVLPPDDRWRVAVQACRGTGGGPGPILAYDINVTNLVIQRNLSDGCDITCDINPFDPSAAGLQFKSYGYYIHCEKIMLGKRRIWVTGISQPSDVDEKNGVLHLKCKGFAAYPKGIPWLEDLNWLANDAFRPVVEIWNHLQSFPNGDLGVTVTPQTSGVEMLPGYAFDGNLLNLNFFATFVRATDKLDCGDYINALARDVPFDYMEISQWNADRTGVNKTFQLGYPRLGLIQQNIAFVLSENVLTAKPHTEAATEYDSDVGITGWFPGIEYSANLSNADPDRLRRYLDEVDALIDSNERAAAWAHRRLARRQTPPFWETITINPEHPNAPMGSFDVGDTITVQGNMPWFGYIAQDHKIIAISVDVAKNVWQLSLKAEGAFNYDPIFFPAGATNIIDNAGFDYNLNGWTATGPGWSWDGSQGHTHLGTATIMANGADHDILTQGYGLSHFEIFPIAIYVKCSGAVGSGAAIQLVAQFYDDTETPTTAVEVAAVQNPAGMVPWQKLAGNVLTPAGSTHVALRVHVDHSMSAGQVWIDDGLLQV